jgi:hypothetical protein
VTDAKRVRRRALLAAIAASATRDGDLVRVSTTPPDVDDETTERVTATLEPVDGAPDARRFVPEQVMRHPYRALRNALGFLDDAARLELETTARWAERATGYDATAKTFRFEGDAYEFSWKRTT